MFLRIAPKMVMRLWHLRTAARLCYKHEKGLRPRLILLLPADRVASLTDVTAGPCAFTYSLRGNIDSW